MKIYSCWVNDQTMETYTRHWFVRKKKWEDFIKQWEPCEGIMVLNPHEREAPTNAEGWVELLNKCEMTSGTRSEEI